MRRVMSKAGSILAVAVILLTALPLAVHASSPNRVSHAALLEVRDQRAAEGAVIVASVFSHGPGYVVIYTDVKGNPGYPIGHAWVDAGWSYNVQVQTAMSRQISSAHAILHGDSGQAGVYELGMAWGADGPVLFDGAPITVAFKIYHPALRM